jgi:hypothetical protein
MSREPTLTDGVVYYLADGVSAGVQDVLEEELKKKNPDGWTVLGGFLSRVACEAVKVAVNSQVSPQFKSILDPANDQKRRRLRHERD